MVLTQGSLSSLMSFHGVSGHLLGLLDPYLHGLCLPNSALSPNRETFVAVLGSRDVEVVSLNISGVNFTYPTSAQTSP